MPNGLQKLRHSAATHTSEVMSWYELSGSVKFVLKTTWWTYDLLPHNHRRQRDTIKLTLQNCHTTTNGYRFTVISRLWYCQGARIHTAIAVFRGVIPTLAVSPSLQASSVHNVLFRPRNRIAPLPCGLFIRINNHLGDLPSKRRLLINDTLRLPVSRERFCSRFPNSSPCLRSVIDKKTGVVVRL